MAVYIITYDLNASGQDYEELFDRIEAYPAHIHPLKSVWFIRSSRSAIEVREDLSRTVDENDQIWVSRVRAGEWASFRLGGDYPDWLKANL